MNQAYRIVEDNADFLLVDKAPGIAFHGDKVHEGGEPEGLLSLIKAEQGLAELYPVHRLDKVTSGLLVFAKTTAANRTLSMQFERREVEKYYLALSRRKPKKKQGKISGDMERGRRGAWKLSPTMKSPAVTQFFSLAVGGGCRLFLLKPKTGKTHQLRVALKSIGSPIVGDALYGGEDSAAPSDRAYLHAYSLAFTLNERNFRFVCPPEVGDLFLSPEFEKACETYRKPWCLPWPA